MADELASAFTFQQTLHGYGEGHRLLAGSASLPARDVRTMLILSDSSGGGTKLPIDGYLTGYPLSESAKYVVARTWPAPEMSRPGCVWTHSILIDFSDLAALRSASPILSLFKRPESKTRGPYDKDLRVTDSTSVDPSVSDAIAAGELAGAVYGHPKRKIVGGLDSGFDENLVIQLWMQQWPRLRRSFRFCTFTSSDRSTPTETFDVQLVPSADRIPRMRIVDVEVPTSESLEADLDPVVDDLLNPDVLGLRRFLRESGGEVAGGRSAMRPLSRIFAFVHRQSSVAEVPRAIAALEEIGPSQAVTARQLIVGRLAQEIENIDDRSFQLVLSSARSDAGIDKSIAERIGAELWRRQPASFVDAISENDPLADTMEATLASLDESALLAGIEKQPSVAAEITMRRQDLFRSERFWAISGLDVEKVLASSAADRADDIVASMMACGVVQADPALKKFGARPLIKALEKIGPGLEQEKLGSWLRALSNQKSDLTQALLSRELTFMPLLVTLARATYPDAAGNDGGIDPWVEAVRRATGRVGPEDEDYLRAFLLTRALGWQSEASAALMKCSLETVHRALADGRMPAAGWRLLYQRLPWVAPWREWDRCWRVRQVVAERFVERDLDPLEFGTVVDDPALWRELAVRVADLWRGPKYLKRVRDSLTGSTTETKRQRVAEIDRLLS
ncbi:hypothetical protein ACVIJ6_005074 [Bradyrhizobium sp. USDA 4369]